MFYFEFNMLKSLKKFGCNIFLFNFDINKLKQTQKTEQS